MTSQRTTARIIGVLFIVASAAAIAGGSLLLPLSEPDYLVETAAQQSQIVSGENSSALLIASPLRSFGQKVADWFAPPSDLSHGHYSRR